MTNWTRLYRTVLLMLVGYAIDVDGLETGRKVIVGVLLFLGVWAAMLDQPPLPAPPQESSREET
jgi:hypothetical protein